MKKIVDVYNDLRKKDKNLIANMPLENRIILSQLITNSAADSALRFAWVNRALAQSSNNKTNNSAILSLADAPEEQLIARKITKLLREMTGLTNPIEIFNEEDLDNYISNHQNIVLKQNYPSNISSEMKMFQMINYNNIKFEIANSKEAYNVIESKKCLAEVAQKSKEWLKENVSEYVNFILNKNNLAFTNEELEESCELMTELVSTFLIPTKVYKGGIKGLYELVIKLFNNGFLPVFKFNYSVSGYGVHYPKKDDGTYDIEELKEKLSSENSLMDYLTESLNKNGQVIRKEELINNIEQYGITLQKYIFGHEHSIGYFKPLKNKADTFSLALTEFIVTDVIVEGTAHCGNILHYDENYIFDILKQTKFNGKANLLHFSVEIILYLMYLNEKLINNPSEFKNISVEDFGIQFIVNDNTGDVGIIEFNGRTPSCNFNHYHLLSKYGVGFENCNILPTQICMFTNAKIMKLSKFNKIVRDGNEKKLIKDLVEKTKEKFNERCEIISIQIVNGEVNVNFVYFLNEEDNAKDKLILIKDFYKDNFSMEV
jgi:hypothetical protein